MSVCVCYQCQLVSTVGVNGYVIMSVGISSVSLGVTNVDWCVSVSRYMSSVSVGATYVDWCVIVSVGNCHQCQLVSLMSTGVS